MKHESYLHAYIKAVVVMCHVCCLLKLLPSCLTERHKYLNINVFLFEQLWFSFALWNRRCHGVFFFLFCLLLYRLLSRLPSLGALIEGEHKLRNQALMFRRGRRTWLWRFVTGLARAAPPATDVFQLQSQFSISHLRRYVFLGNFVSW